MSPSDRRESKWINPEFQNHFLKTVFMLEGLAMFAGASLMAVAWCVFYLMPGAFVFHWSIYLGIFLVASVCISLGVVGITLRTSHNICGPIFRVIECLKALRRHEHPGFIQFRQDDYFKELEEAVNDTLEVIYDQEDYNTFQGDGGKVHELMPKPGPVQMIHSTGAAAHDPNSKWMAI